jgi:hypothetical protein
MSDDQGAATIVGRHLLPIGIPLGKLPAQAGSQQPRYLVRSRGEFFVLEKDEYCLFCEGPAFSAEETISGPNTKLKHESVGAIARKLITQRLLLEMSGDAELDWPHMKTLRPISRCLVAGFGGEPAGSALLLSLGGLRQAILDAVDFALWSRFDGATKLAAVVEAASDDSGLMEEFLQRRCCGLVASTMSGGFLLLDS